MSRALEFQWEEWLPPFDADSAEGLTFADMKILVKGRFATELEDFYAQTLRRGMYVSAYPVALFLATNWWRLRWEPAFLKDDPEWRMRHNLLAIGDGYAWPDITFASDGEFVMMTARSTGYSDTAPVRYIADFSKWVTAEVFESTVAECIEKVLARLEAVGRNETELEQVWRDVREEKADAGTALWRRLEALAGYDPDEAPETFVRDLLAVSESAGLEAIQELAAASRQRAMEDLKTLQDAVQSRGVDFQIVDFERIADDSRSAVTNTSLPPWRRAYDAARAARRTWGLNGQPVTNSNLGEVIGIQKDVLENAEGRGSALEAPYSASSSEGGQEKSRLILNRKLTTSRRFAACRLIGDRLFSSWIGGISAATDAGTSRQKFQRAFAQEFLCPIDALKSFLDKEIPSDDDIEDAAYHFQVSPRLVHATLVNHHVLPRETMEELF